MRLRLVLATLCVTLAVFLVQPRPASEAAPGLLQLPWPAVHKHHISGGATYGCWAHTEWNESSSTAFDANRYGIDFQFGPIDGSPLDVSAVAAGTVVKADFYDGYGYRVVLDHGGGYFSVYAHFASYAAGIEEGETVAPGQVLGLAGDTGGEYEVHLHFHMQKDMAAYKPEPMSWVSGFERYGYCAPYPNISPYWYSRPPVVIPPGDSDYAVWRPSDRKWWIRLQGAVEWGRIGDIPVPADYDGDGATDIATWRPSNGRWYVRLQPPHVQWGDPDDIPVTGDYYGDDRADLAIWRPSTDTWWICVMPSPDPSCPGQSRVDISWGVPAEGDVPVPGNWDGGPMEISDIAVWRPTNGTWYVYDPRLSVPWGLIADIPLAGQDAR
jgi:hypothetical protein